jgi:hypothetical protein
MGPHWGPLWVRRAHFGPKRGHGANFGLGVGLISIPNESPGMSMLRFLFLFLFLKKMENPIFEKWFFQIFNNFENHGFCDFCKNKYYF